MKNETNECGKKSCKPTQLHVCWHGFKKGECPRRRLENEKLFLGMLLTISTGILIWMQL